MPSTGCSAQSGVGRDGQPPWRRPGHGARGLHAGAGRPVADGGVWPFTAHARAIMEIEPSRAMGSSARRSPRRRRAIAAHRPPSAKRGNRVRRDGSTARRRRHMRPRPTTRWVVLRWAPAPPCRVRRDGAHCTPSDMCDALATHGHHRSTAMPTAGLMTQHRRAVEETGSHPSDVPSSYR
jgi:hypothetical protein